MATMRAIFQLASSRPICQDWLYRESNCRRALGPKWRKAKYVVPSAPGCWVVEQSPYVEMHRAVLLCMEHLAKDPTTQVFGIAILSDFQGFTPEKVFAMNFGLIRRGIEYLQDCMPIRLKSVPTVNQGTAFDIFFTLTRPFMKKKLAERFHLYGENFEDLHKEIPASVLPEEYGGQAPPADFEGFWTHLETKEDEYREDNAFGYVGKHDHEFATVAEIEEELTFM